MRGLMMDWPLTITSMADYAGRYHGTQEIVTRTMPYQDDHEGWPLVAGVHRVAQVDAREVVVHAARGLARRVHQPEVERAARVLVRVEADLEERRGRGERVARRAGRGTTKAGAKPPDRCLMHGGWPGPLVGAGAERRRGWPPAQAGSVCAPASQADTPARGGGRVRPNQAAAAQAPQPAARVPASLSSRSD